MLARIIKIRDSGSSKDNGDPIRATTSMDKTTGLLNKAVITDRHKAVCSTSRACLPSRAIMSTREADLAQVEGAVLRCWVR